MVGVTEIPTHLVWGEDLGKSFPYGKSTEEAEPTNSVRNGFDYIFLLPFRSSRTETFVLGKDKEDGRGALWEKPPNDVYLVAYVKVAKVREGQQTASVWTSR